MRAPRGNVPDGPPSWPLAVTWLPPLLLSLYPSAATLAANITWLPMDWRDVARAAAASLGIAVLLLVVLQRFDRQRGGMANWLGAALLAFVTYGWLCDVAGLDKENGFVATVYAAASLGLATVAVRPRRDLRHDPIPLLIVATVMLASAGVRATLLQPSRVERARWQEATDALTAPPRAAHSAEPAGAAARDIYYIIVDGFGRADVLREYYDVDLQPFVSFLRARGFDVPDRAQSNYAQTFLSIASTLNLNYLDGVSSAMGRDASDRRPLASAIRHNALMALARRSGYQVVAIASDYEATEAFEGVDRCWCARYGASGFEQAVIASTPLAALPLASLTVDGHARKVRESFSALATARPAGRPTFAFAHVIAPHPPFVFNEDGSRRTPTHVLGEFADGPQFAGSRAEYVSGYREQTRFVVRELMALVTTLLDRPGPSPVIVIHGDHGPGLNLDWSRPERADLRERMAIFSAYRLPGDGPALYATMTPVNGARTLATRYFGVTLPYLADRSHFSTWLRPYDDVTVTTP